MARAAEAQIAKDDERNGPASTVNLLLNPEYRSQITAHVLRLMMLTRKPAYTVRIEGDAALIRWNISRYAASGRTVYIHGRDYPDLYLSNDIARMEGNSYTYDIEGRPENSDKRYVRLAKDAHNEAIKSRFSVDLTSSPHLLTPNERIAAVLSDKKKGAAFAQSSSDAFLNTLNRSLLEADATLRSEVSLLRASIAQLMVAENTLTSLHEMEDSIASAIILNAAHHARDKCQIILGPSRYRHLTSAKQIPRPMVRESEMLAIYARSVEASVADSSRHFEQWASLPANPIVIKSGKRKSRYLTQGDIERFVRWQPDNDEPDIPDQVPGALNVVVVGGRLEQKTQEPIAPDRLAALKIGVSHLIDLIEDVEKSAYLHNWSPGANAKLARLKAGLQKISRSTKPNETISTRVALDGESFRHSYEAHKEELSISAEAEFAPLLVQMNLVFTQIQSWKKFKSFGESVEWGRNFSQSYRDALGNIALDVGSLPNKVAAPEIKRAMNEAIQQIQSTNPVEQVAATANVRNVISGMFKFLRPAGASTLKGASAALEEGAKEGTGVLLKTVAISMRDKLVVLANTNPNIFGWLLRVLADS